MAAFDRVLVLETAGRVGQVALASGDALVAEAPLEQARRRASDLALAVAALLQGQGWAARELTAVIVGLGPGSYTGLRVGLASAKALAYATGAAFFGVETFAAIAARGPAEVQRLSVVGDALQGKLFRHDIRRAADGSWGPAGPLEVVESADWLASLQPDTWVSGPAAGAFDGRLPAGARVADPGWREPRPVDLLTAARTLSWAVTTDVWAAEPFYLRGSSAEEKAKSARSAADANGTRAGQAGDGRQAGQQANRAVGGER
jgi:tRNA threonylcarbamoyladenosine biosynthesis protein TsaB